MCGILAREARSRAHLKPVLCGPHRSRGPRYASTSARAFIGTRLLRMLRKAFVLVYAPPTRVEVGIGLGPSLDDIDTASDYIVACPLSQ